MQLITPRPLLLFTLLAVAAACLVVLLALAVFLERRKKWSAGAPLNLVGRVGTAQSDLDPEGFVMVGGEVWPARVRGGGRVARGSREVRVVGARGRMLEVEAAGE